MKRIHYIWIAIIAGTVLITTALSWLIWFFMIRTSPTTNNPSQLSQEFKHFRIEVLKKIESSISITPVLIEEKDSTIEIAPMIPVEYEIIDTIEVPKENVTPKNPKPKEPTPKKNTLTYIDYDRVKNDFIEVDVPLSEVNTIKGVLVENNTPNETDIIESALSALFKGEQRMLFKGVKIDGIQKNEDSAQIALSGEPMISDAQDLHIFKELVVKTAMHYVAKCTITLNGELIE